MSDPVRDAPVLVGHAVRALHLTAWARSTSRRRPGTRRCWSTWRPSSTGPSSGATGEPRYADLIERTLYNVVAKLTFVPYHLWGNRGPSTRRVWTPASGRVLATSASATTSRRRARLLGGDQPARRPRAGTSPRALPHAANEVTATGWDPVSEQPRYKVTAVRLTRMEG
ncbi:hypothetical protein [Nonomuraea jiangxiensis]|uniref:hypothetical protein n=1 Tax=Nonomuraea jiangxiensis TaxID=633440 RepID=UPI000B85F28B|nr:hypothetical protein [Nonomuraea jiangxiensis]